MIFRAALSALPGGWLQANRDTPRDVGTRATAESERRREGLLDIVIAAGKRLSEALRVIEEMSKTINADLAQQIEALRYRAYDLRSAPDVALWVRPGETMALVSHSDAVGLSRPWRAVLQGAIEGGADCVQVREKQCKAASDCARGAR